MTLNGLSCSAAYLARQTEMWQRQFDDEAQKHIFAVSMLVQNWFEIISLQRAWRSVGRQDESTSLLCVKQNRLQVRSRSS